MAIIYPDELKMTECKTIISERIDFDPEIYIYVQKLMKDESKSFNKVVNDIIRERAENNFCKKVEYIPIITPVPYEPYPRITYSYDSSVTNESVSKTLSDIYDEENDSTR